MPDLDLSPETHGKVAPRRREGKRGNARLEGEVVEHHAALEVGQYGLAIFVDGEEEVALRGQADAGNVLAVGEGEGMRLVPGSSSQSVSQS